MSNPLPQFPKTYQRHTMEPTERIESYIEMAERLLDRIAEEPDGDRAYVVALSLASAYAEGHQDGRTYGYSDGFIAGKGGPQEPMA